MQREVAAYPMVFHYLLCSVILVVHIAHVLWLPTAKVTKLTEPFVASWKDKCLERVFCYMSSSMFRKARCAQIYNMVETAAQLYGAFKQPVEIGLKELETGCALVWEYINRSLR